MSEKRGNVNIALMINVVILLIIGIMMVTSASMPYAELMLDDKWHFVKRELIWVVIGLVACLVAINFPMEVIYPFIDIAFYVSLFMLFFVAATPLGHSINGAKRWLGLGGLLFSPTDFAKVIIVLYMAKYYHLYQSKSKDWHTLIWPVLCLLGIGILIMVQPDLGTTITIGLTCVVIIFVAGTPWKYMLYLLSGAGCVVFLYIFSAEYRLARFMTFFIGDDTGQGAGYQIRQSLYALGSGGFFGVGYQASKQKMMYLPESYTDFIYSIIGEEFGFIGCALLACLFIFLFINGLKIAKRTSNTFYSLTAIGLTTLITFQAFVNMVVAAGGCPVTGITLPFISYGGSSLVSTMISVGLLLNISRKGRH